MQDKIQACQVSIVLLILHTHHTRKVGAIILPGVVLWFLAVLVFQAVNIRRNDRQLGRQVQAVFQGRFPIDILLHPLVVAAGKHRTALQRQHRLREQGQRMGLFGHCLEHLIYMVWHIGAPGPLGLHFQRLFPAGDFANHQQVVQTAHVRDLGAARARQPGQNLGDRQAAETDAFSRVYIRDIRYQALHIAHTAVNLLDGHLANLHFPMLFHQFFNALTPGRQLSRDLFFQ